MAYQRRNDVDDGMIEKVVSINRVSKTVKGGRVAKFAALVVVGDGKGKIGFGIGKSGEVPEAIRKGLEAAKKNMRTVNLKGTTIRTKSLRSNNPINVVSATFEGLCSLTTAEEVAAKRGKTVQEILG